jgi:hypothetical protein
MRTAAVRNIVISLSTGVEHVAAADDVTAFTSQEAGAVFDVTRKYRYLLWRTWCLNSPMICFIMLNPSTADAFKTDPTIARCISFAKRWEFGSIHIVNLFAYRATQPDKLAATRRPVGTLNDEFVAESVRSSAKVMLAWGNHGQLRNRCTDVLDLLGYDSRLHHLGLTQQGHPRHPLYVRGDVEAILFDRRMLTAHSLKACLD